MPTALKRNAVLLLALSIAFCMFFYASKHKPALNHNNPFAEDPYDAVGSFAIQFAIFSSALSVFRAFRTYSGTVATASQEQLVATGEVTGASAVAITMIADLLALCRHPELWSRASGLPLLLGMIAGLFAWAATILAGSLRYRTHVGARLRNFWLRPLFSIMVGMAVVAFYPERFRAPLFGALITVLIGALALFVPLRSIALATAPKQNAHVFDLGEDLLLITRFLGGWRCRRTGTREAAGHSHAARPALTRLLARRFLWTGVVACGAVIGLGLGMAELLRGDAVPVSRRGLVLAIYVGLEMAAVLMGFVLLRKPLRLSARQTWP